MLSSDVFNLVLKYAKPKQIVRLLLCYEMNWGLSVKCDLSYVSMTLGGLRELIELIAGFGLNVVVVGINLRDLRYNSDVNSLGIDLGKLERVRMKFVLDLMGGRSNVCDCLGFRRMKNVRHLVLSNFVSRRFEVVDGFDKLRSCKLNSCVFDDFGNYLSECGQLRCLYLSGMDLDYCSLMMVGGLGVKKMVLNYVEWSDRGEGEGLVIENKVIKYFSVNNCAIGCLDLFGCVNLLKFKALNGGSVRHKKIELPSSIRAITCCQKKCCDLIVYGTNNLCRLKLGSDDLWDLSKFVNCKSLRYIDARGCRKVVGVDTLGDNVVIDF